MTDLLHTFHDVLGQHSLAPEEILADGNLHRCPTEGKSHKLNGAYIAHLDKPATLWWCNWETDDQGTFCAEEKQTLSVSELSAWAGTPAIHPATAGNGVRQTPYGSGPTSRRGVAFSTSVRRQPSLSAP